MTNKARFYLLLIVVLFSKTIFSQLVISEIMYHPAELDLPYPDYEDREDAEFLEIWNSGTAAIDVSNYSFDGISYCFPTGTTLTQGQRIILTKDATVFQNVFGLVPFGVYEGKLSNSGEKILLVDDQGIKIHEVDYEDNHHWPVLADGLGQSLELICTNCDNEAYQNWGASTDSSGHTAGVVNSISVSGNYPAIDSFTIDTKPAPGQIVNFSAWMPGATSATVEYTVNWGATQQISGTLVGGVASFSFPPFSATDIIHYSIKAHNSIGTFSMPHKDDLMATYSFIISNPNLQPSNFPILNWYYDSITPHEIYTTLEYDGITINDIYTWKRRGKHWRFEFPKGHKFEMPGFTTMSVSDLQLNRPDHTFSAWVNGTMARTTVYTDIIAEQGEPKMDAFNVRVDLNGERSIMWTYLTWPNGDWREAVGITDGHEYYKFPANIVLGTPIPSLKHPEGGSDASIWEALIMKDSIGPHLMDMYDIPRMVNFMALSTLICHWDAGTKNFYIHKHPNGRWEGDIWDVDAAPRTGIDSIEKEWCLCGEMPRQGLNPNASNAGNTFALPLLANSPRVKEMYHRRIRTLIDIYFAPGELMNRVLAQADPSDPDVDSTANHYSVNHNITQHQHNIYVNYPEWQLSTYDTLSNFPPSATGVSDIVINEIQYAPVGGDQEEFIELYNNSNESIDMSQWQLEGVGLTFPHGTVILANDFLVVASWSPSFITKYGSGKYVAADFEGARLNNNGETLRLIQPDGTIEDEVIYEQAGWKQAHGGASLERISSTGPSNDQANWAPSVAPFGTPDAPNNSDTNANYPPNAVAADIIINEIMYHSDTLNALSGASFDFVEIRNNATTVVDVSGFKIKGISYTFPDQTTLQPSEIIVIAPDKHTFNIKYGFQPFDTYDGKLDNNGETLEIISPSGYKVDIVTFNDNNPWDEAPDGNGYSLELLHPTLDNFEFINWFRSDNLGGTPNAENSRICNVNASSIVINEINYNSNNTVNDPGDWVEIHNPGTVPLNVSGWTFYDNNNAFIFPVGTILDSNSFLVLVENDAMFALVFPNVPSHQKLGDFVFSLSNKGERISLFDSNKCLSDYVIFDDRSPWDTLPDGNGPTLSLIDPVLDNALPGSWEASSNINAPLGTPGRANVPCSTFTIQSPPEICKGDTLLLHTTSNINANVSWTIQGGTPATATNDSVYVVFQNPGLALVELEVSYYECISMEQQLLTVETCNTAPNPLIDNYTINEDSTLTSNVLSNDQDPENQLLNVSLVVDVLNGSLTLNPDGNFTYVPYLNYYGSDNFIYEVCDNGTPILCATQVVNIIINSVNDSPTTIPDLYTTTEDNSVAGNVLSNDTDVEGDVLSATVSTPPTNGIVTLQVNGNFTYTPNLNYFGSEAFVYEVCDDGISSICLTENVTLSITPVNDPPVAVQDIFTINEDNSLNNNVLTNDTELENQPMVANLVSNTANGVITLYANGDFDYTPPPNYFGVDSFSYNVCDDTAPALCATASAIINVLPINDLPIIRNDTFATNEGIQLTANASSNDFDLETPQMSYTLVSFTQNGSVLFNFDGSFYYTPFAGFSGTESFQYMACDNGSPNYCDTATVYIEVIKECVTLDISLFLEGAFDTQTELMNTTLNTVRAVLPGMTANPISGQPYSGLPWNYQGTEGTDWTNTDYSPTIVDWVLISLRTGVAKSTQVAQVAGLLHTDGTISFPGECLSATALTETYYIVAEHRNHMAVMSPVKVSVINRTLSWDFRLANSCYAQGGSGAKELVSGVWGLFGGDSNQIDDLVSYDINGKDKSAWLLDNGNFGVYLNTDNNMNGDVNGSDKALWLLNNGVFGSVQK